MRFSANTKCGKCEFTCEHVFYAKNNFPEDALWKINTSIGSLIVRINNGKEGINNFISRFIFECMQISTTHVISTKCTDRINYNIIPQYNKLTGRCWWTAMILCLTYPKSISELFIKSISGRIPECHKYISNIMNGSGDSILEDSEKLRHIMYNEFKVGDPPNIAPSLEGKNGMFEMIKLFNAIEVPTIVLSYDGNKFTNLNITSSTTNPKVLIIHVMRQRWVPAKTLNIEDEVIGGKWGIQSIFIGQEDAGHQMAAATCDGSVTDWIIGCSDAALLGTLAMWISCKDVEWVDALNTLIPILQKKSLMSFAIENRSQVCATHGQNCEIPGVTNIDCVYTKI